MKLNEWCQNLVPRKAADRLLKDTGMRNPWIRKTAFVIDQINSDYFSNIFKNSKASNIEYLIEPYGTYIENTKESNGEDQKHLFGDIWFHSSKDLGKLEKITVKWTKSSHLSLWR